MISNITDWFKVKVGVCQGYLLSSTLFNIFLELMINEICSIQHTLKLFLDMSTETTDHTTLITAF